MTDNRLVSATRIGDINRIRSHFGEFGNVVETMGESNRKGGDNLLAFS